MRCSLAACERRDALFLSRVAGATALQHHFRAAIRLLEVDAPVPQFLERNHRPGDCATDESARPHDAEIAIQVFDFRLSGTRGPTICTIEQEHLRHLQHVPGGGSQPSEQDMRNL